MFVAPSKTNTTLQPLMGDYSVIMVEGARHKQQRQLLMPPFYKERMPAYSQLICNLTEKVFSQLPQNQPFQARNVLQEKIFDLSAVEICAIPITQTCHRLVCAP